MKVLDKIKLSGLIIIGIIINIIIVDLFITKQNNEKILKIKNEYSRTNLENVFLKKDKKIELIIINQKRIKKFKNLDNIGELKKGEPILINKNGKYGYIKPNGEMLIPMKYDAVGVFIQDKILIKKNEKIGVLDKDGKSILPLKYDEIYIGKNNNFILKDKNKYIAYNLNKRIELDVDKIYSLNEKIIIFSKKNKFGIMNYMGEVIIPNEFNEISTFIDKLFIGAKLSKYGIYNLKNEKISKDYDFIEQLSNNEYKGGNNEKGKYALITEHISTEDKYEDIKKYNKTIYIGNLGEGVVDVIDIESGAIKTIKDKDVEKYIKEIQKERSNE